MATFTVHTAETAPDGAKDTLNEIINARGGIANLHGVMAEAPELLKGYLQLHELFKSSSFNDEELTVVWQTINVEHECHYCVPAHTAIAESMGVDPTLTDALRNGKPMPSEKLQALHETTLAMVKNRGNLSQDDLEKFYNAGYEARQLLEIVLGLSQKVISNYVNRIAETPIDAMFKRFEWHKQ